MTGLIPLARLGSRVRRSLRVVARPRRRGQSASADPSPKPPGPFRFGRHRFGRTRVRFTIGLKLTTLSGIGLLVAVVIGGTSFTSVGKIKVSCDLRSTLSAAANEFAKLDKLSSDAQVVERDMIMATNDDDRTTAVNRLATIQRLADESWGRTERLPLPADLKKLISGVRGEYNSYLKAVAEELPILGSLGVTSPEATTALAREQGRAEAVRAQFKPVLELMSSRDEAARQATDGRAAEVQRTVLLAWLIGLSALLVAALVITRSITSRLRALRVRMAEIADGNGDLTARLSEDAKDETGDVARAANRFIVRVQELVGQMAGASAVLAGSVERLAEVSIQLTNSADTTSTQAAEAFTVADAVSQNVQAVAGSTEELGSSIRSIAGNAAEAARVTTEASACARSVRTTFTELRSSSTEIDSVLNTITAIATQTNLLALNATIEAARAGELGKGFAIVATEVKDLAQSTANATKDITQRISTIQATTEAAAAAIGQIVAIVDRINEYSTTIASSVTEQTLATSEISRNVVAAANGASAIAGNIQGVSRSAHDTAGAASVAAETTRTVASVVTDLYTTASRFRY